MKTFDLTPKEFRAATLFVASCLDGMGGDRPIDLERDEYTWIGADVLIKSGYSRHEAAGLMSALSVKGFISEYEKNKWIVNTSGWQWLDAVWDAIVAEAVVPEAVVAVWDAIVARDVVANNSSHTFKCLGCNDTVTSAALCGLCNTESET